MIVLSKCLCMNELNTIEMRTFVLRIILCICGIVVFQAKEDNKKQLFTVLFVTGQKYICCVVFFLYPWFPLGCTFLFGFFILLQKLNLCFVSTSVRV